MNTIAISNNNATIYQAKYPDILTIPLNKKILKVFVDFLSVILFPIGIVRLVDFGLRVLVTRLAILPAARVKFPEISENRVQFKTPDGVTLEGIYLEGKIPGKAIAICMGNGMSCQRAFDQKEGDNGTYQFLADAGYSILAFNPRGVGKSGGIPLPETLQLDSYSALSYLREEKKMEKVGFYGISLGAANGVRGAALFDPSTPLILDRTFDNLILETKTVITRLFRALKESKKCSRFWWQRLVKVIPPTFAGKCAAFFIFLLRLQINARKAYDKMTGPSFCIAHAQDGIIPIEVSLMKNNGRFDGMFINDIYNPEGEDLIDAYSTQAYFHLRPLEKDEQIHILNFLQKSLL